MIMTKIEKKSEYIKFRIDMSEVECQAPNFFLRLNTSDFKVFNSVLIVYYLFYHHIFLKLIVIVSTSLLIETAGKCSIYSYFKSSGLVMK